MRHSLLDRQIGFHRAFVELTDSITASLLLSQAVYWALRTPERWFYKTREDWTFETGLSRREQENARRVLREFTFWKEDLRGIPATMHFSVDIEDLETQVLSACKKYEKDSRAESAQQVVSRGTSLSARNEPTPSLLENTDLEEMQTTAWGDSHPDGFCRFICSQVLRVPGFEKFYPKRDRVEDLVTWLRTFMPDEDSVKAELESWVAWNKDQPKPRGRVDVVQRLRNWFARKVSRYAQQRRSTRRIPNLSFASSNLNEDAAIAAERILRDGGNVF